MGAVSFRVTLLVTACAAFFLCAHGARAQETSSSSPQAGITGFPQPSGWPLITGGTSSSEVIGPGVFYQRYQLTTQAGPLEVSLATIDLNDPYVALVVATQHGTITGPDERLSGIADRLRAEVGINADYFDINESGSPLNIVGINGRILHEPDQKAAFIVQGDKQVTMSPLVWSGQLTLPTGATLPIGLVNEWSVGANLALLTAEFGSVRAYDATEAVLVPIGGDQYKVAQLDQSLTELDALPTNELAIVAHGDSAQVLAQMRVGDVVHLSAQGDNVLASMTFAVGGGPLLVKDGQPFIDPSPPAPEETDVRNPVTGAGISRDGRTLWLVVVDGRVPARSIGLTRPQLAEFFIALGAQMAMAFDSGGSSEMVIRHLGDPQASVANTPSDGRERSIADGLFVLNTAPVGPAVRLIVAPQHTSLFDRAPALLKGSSLAVVVHGVDENEQPVTIAPSDITLSTNDPATATITSSGLLTARGSGNTEVTASANGVRGLLRVRVVPSIDSLEIVVPLATVPTGGKSRLSVQAATSDAQPIVLDTSAIHWASQGRQGQVLADGTFVAGPMPAKTLVMARAGGATASAIVLSGEHSATVQGIPQPGSSPGTWHYVARPPDLPGGVDATSAPDGAAALRLAYDFSSTSTTRAAYAQTELALAGQPLALAIDVYGDRNGEWLRGGYRNADGNDESLTLARHVDWQGWKTIRVSVPHQAAWPIVWTRFYVVEASKGAKEQGSLWFRNFTLFFAGP